MRTTPAGDARRDVTVAADYVASLGTHYQEETTRPRADVVTDVRRPGQAVIDEQAAFVTSGDLAAFLCG